MNEHPWAEGIDEVRPRTSALAVLSLVLGLVSLAVCCVPLAGPAVGVLAILVGTIALFAIAGSGGLKKGNGVAATGVVAGLIGVILGAALIVGAAWVADQGGRFAGVIAMVDAGNVPGVADGLSSDAAGRLDQAAADAFKAGYEAEHGGFVSTPKGLLEYVKGYAEVGQLIESATGQAEAMYSVEHIVPVPVRFEGGLALVLCVVNETGRVENIGVVSSDGSEIIWLVEPGG